MNIGRIYIWLLNKSANHPVLAAHGALHRNYWFYQQGIGGKFARRYEGTEDTEQRRNAGIWPLSQFATDNKDLVHDTSEDRFRVQIMTVEEVAAETVALEKERVIAQREREEREAHLAALDRRRKAIEEEQRAIEDGAPLASQRVNESVSEGVTELKSEENLQETPTTAAPPATKPASRRKLPT